MTHPAPSYNVRTEGPNEGEMPLDCSFCFYVEYTFLTKMAFSCGVLLNEQKQIQFNSFLSMHVLTLVNRVRLLELL